MLTLVQITAILSVLLAFGVDLTTVNNIRDIITPKTATSTEIVIVPVIQSPIIQNAPVYFGSTQPTEIPVNNQQTTQNPVVQSVVMEPVQPNIDSVTIDRGVLHVSSDILLDIGLTTFTNDVTLGAVEFENTTSRIGKWWNGHGYGVELNNLPAEYTPIDVTLVSASGGQVTKTVIVR